MHSGDLVVGKIGRYEVVSELGRGAMGVVYRALDPNIGRTVALKTLRLDVHGLQLDDMMRRFKNEARAAGAMNHPNIVTIYDADESEGLFYIAMEFVEGDTLQSLMLEKRLIAPEQVVDITRQVCAGLDYAHSLKVIHRDIKPANIMITPQNTAKIMDFGIAKAVGTMTSSGQVLGTPNYMSPEQVRGLDLDGRSDLFSFGVVLYEMVTGEKPFSGENVATIIYKIVNEEPIPPHNLNAGVHPAISDIITRILNKNPEERYQNGAALARDMENYRSAGNPEVVTSVLPADAYAQAAAKRIQWPTQANGTLAGMQAKTAPAPAGTSSRANKQTMPPAQPSAPVPGKKRSAKLALAMLSAVLAVTIAYQVKHYRKIGSTVPPIARVQSATPRPTTPFPATANPQSEPASDDSTNTPAEDVDTKPATTKTKSVEKASSKGQIDLHIDSDPRGASVQIDGTFLADWITPFTAPGLTPGMHRIVFTKRGYEQKGEDFEVSPRNTSLSEKLSAAASSLSVSSEPAGASIDIDAIPTGKVTPAQLTVTPGDHRVVVHKDGYHSAEVLAYVDDGQTFSFAPLLNPMSSRDAGNTNPLTARLGRLFGGGVPAGKGMIDFRTNPPGARILVNGAEARIATPAHAPMAPGDYTITLVEPGYKPVQQNVHVEAGRRVNIDLQLEPQ